MAWCGTTATTSCIRHDCCVAARPLDAAQFLQYHVVSDSKPVACLLLSLSGATYPPAFQLALDMFKARRFRRLGWQSNPMQRLELSDTHIFDALLQNRQVLAALRFARARGATVLAEISPRQFLEAAVAAEDDVIFYAGLPLSRARLNKCVQCTSSWRRAT